MVSGPGKGPEKPPGQTINRQHSDKDMESNSDKKVMLFGCPADCDEKFDAIREKQNFLKTGTGFNDPLHGVLAGLEDGPAMEGIPAGAWENLGSLPVPEWLGPAPGADARSQLTTENMISFIDSDGCRSLADGVAEFVSRRVLPHLPVMIGIDHSLTGGLYSALTRHYGKGNVSLIVIDSHTDAVPMGALAGAVQYDAQTNPSSLHDEDDPFLYNRPDSYNASSFLDCLIRDGVVDPKQLYLIGVSDFPDKKSLRIKDDRMKQYTNAYLGLRRKGARIITKKECKLSPKKVKGLLNSISTPYAHLSIDMDIGANNALNGVRFRNWTGLNEAAIYKIADMVTQVFARSTQLVGMDICEIDPRRAGELLPSGRDRTYDIAAELIRKIIFKR